MHASSFAPLTASTPSTEDLRARSCDRPPNYATVALRSRARAWEVWMMSAVRVVLTLAVTLSVGCPLVSTKTSSTMPGGGGPQPTATNDAVAPSGTGPITVPNLIGKTKAEAIALVKAAGFQHEVESSRPIACVDAPEEPGRINCQDPEPGKVVARYTMIQVNVYEEHRMAGIIARREIEALHGMTPDQAKARLKQLGHTGEVIVHTVMNAGGGDGFDPKCGDNKVCSTSGDGGIGLDHRITLYINPVLTIAPPPED